MESTSPKVSVIIPCYNCQKYIAETLESLESQTFHDFETICVDDGSTDSTSTVLTKISKESKLNIRIITQENSGVSVARNRGIEEAKGKYILFLDSDDVYHPDFIKILVSTKENTGVDASYCRLSRNLAEVFAVKSIMETPVVKQTQEEAMNKLLFEMWRYGFCCYLYERKTLNELTIRFDENTRRLEDREFNWKYLAHCKTLAWIDQPLYHYRMNAFSVTNQKEVVWSRTKALDVVKRIERYLEKYEVPFRQVFNSYMYARVMWGLLKKFAVGRNKNLFNRMTKEYDVRACMKTTAKDANKLVAFASVLFLINPKLFYFAVGLWRR